MIFFDIDGTLLDHKYAEYWGVKAFYEENKQYFQIDADDFYHKWCQTSAKYFRKYLDGELSYVQQKIGRVKEMFALADITLSDSEAEARFQTYLLNYERNWKLYEDVIPCLNGLKGYRLGIISNGDHHQQVRKLEQMGIKDFFEVIVTAGDAGAAKPDVRIFQIACEKAGTVPANCCYVGDELNTDIVPCEQLGMIGIWLNRREVRNDMPNINMISGLAELKTYLNEEIIL